MLIEEIFTLTSQLFNKVIQKARMDDLKCITREYVEKIADENKMIKNHIAKEYIISHVLFDV